MIVDTSRDLPLLDLWGRYYYYTTEALFSTTQHGNKCRYPIRAWSGITVSLHWKQPLKVVWVLDQDASWTALCGVIVCRSNWKQTQKRWKDYISFLACEHNPWGIAGGGGWAEGHAATMSRAQISRGGWMDAWMHTWKDGWSSLSVPKPVLAGSECCSLFPLIMKHSRNKMNKQGQEMVLAYLGAFVYYSYAL